MTGDANDPTPGGPSPAGPRIRRGQFAPKYVVLHVGCGPGRSEDLPQMFPPELWTELRFDINPAAKPDIVGSMMDLGMIEDGAIDGIFSNSNLEHVYAHEAVRAVAEFIRVLQPKGLLVVGVPDLRQIAEEIVADRLEEPAFQAPAGAITPIDMLYGHRGFLSRGMDFMAHKTGFTATSLRRLLEDSGFPQVTITEMPWRLFAVACKVRTSTPDPA